MGLEKCAYGISLDSLPSDCSVTMLFIHTNTSENVSLIHLWITDHANNNKNCGKRKIPELIYNDGTRLRVGYMFENPNPVFGGSIDKAS